MAETDHLAQDATRQISDIQMYITYESVLFGIVVWVSEARASVSSSTPLMVFTRSTRTG